MKNYDELIVRYLDNQLTEEEAREFKRELETNVELKEAYQNFNKVKKMFSETRELSLGQEYSNGIVPRFRGRMSERASILPIKRISYAFVTLILVFTSYFIFKGYFLNSGTEEYTLQSITANLSEDDMNELEDYVSNDYLELISGKDEFILPAEFDFSMEAMLTDVSPEEKVMIMSDYHINEIYSLVDEEEFEIAYNEILSKIIF